MVRFPMLEAAEFIGRVMLAATHRSTFSSIIAIAKISPSVEQTDSLFAASRINYPYNVLSLNENSFDIKNFLFYKFKCQNLHL
jgi:hypothetical protein